ncbi:TIGR03750 family conjugal transfer protein [Kineobactrum sediminis]|uniref:TIGR03750 family conjugal transfer protein n=1 Tax=Kineobactrum sediminis TaxID=1905677 RepID=UPI001F4E6DDC|nr:TIGR03750 family conjugal transfer protein [Kineobactrum sediminis]
MGPLDTQEILADRLNAEPVIFRGCSASELGVIVALAAAVWLPLSLLLAWLGGAVTMGFGIAGIGIVATVLGIASLFQRLKRNRPDGYYQQRCALWLDDKGLKRSPFINRSGTWDIGRRGHVTLPLRHR